MCTCPVPKSARSRSLIGGSTAYNADGAALYAIRKEWTRQDADYGTRVGQLLGTLTGWLNGPYLLNATPGSDDAEPDALSGGPDKDLFFQGAGDHVSGKSAGRW